MSAPVRELGDNGSLKDGPLNYAPKKARRPEQDLNQESAPTRINFAPPSGVTESREPPWKQKMQPGAFVGDVAIVELRNQLAMVSDRIPEPPFPESSGSRFATAGRIVGAVTVAAAAAVGYLWGSAPPATPSQQQAALASGEASLVAPERLAPAVSIKTSSSIRTSSSNESPSPVRPATIGLAPASATALARGEINAVAPGGAAQRVVTPSVATPNPEPRVIAPPAVPAPVAAQPVLDPPVSLSRSVEPLSAGQSSRASAPVRATPRQLTVNAVRTRQADEPARLAISASGAGANVAVVIVGLAPGSALSAGVPAGPNTWRLSADDFSDAAITPPRGFVGVMDLTVELRLADNTVADRKGLQLEWSGKSALAAAQAQTRRIDAAEIALLMKNGAEFMANGNIGAARLMFQPAAEAGDPVAAFALAETYDPLVLRKLGAKGGITSDVALAQSWYEKAKDLGSTVAPERLVRLTRRSE